MAQKRGPWSVLKTDQLFKDPYIEVHHDHVLRPDGSPGTYATVIIKPGVCALPVDGEGFVYLVRQFRYALDRNSLEVVCGGKDDHESPLIAAKREMREELGIEATTWHDMGAVDTDTSVVRGSHHLFIAQGLTHFPPQLDSTEDIVPVKMTLADALKEVMTGGITHSSSCVLLLKAQALFK